MLNQQLYLFPEQELVGESHQLLTDLSATLDATDAQTELMNDIANAVTSVVPGGSVFVGHSPALDPNDLVDSFKAHLSSYRNEQGEATLPPDRTLTIALPPQDGGLSKQRYQLAQRIAAAVGPTFSLRSAETEDADHASSPAQMDLPSDWASALHEMAVKHNPPDAVSKMLRRRRISLVFITDAERLAGQPSARSSDLRICDFLKDVGRESGTVFVFLGFRKSLLDLRTHRGIDRLPDAHWVFQRMYDYSNEGDMDQWLSIVTELIGRFKTPDEPTLASNCDKLAETVGGDVSRLARWFRTAAIEAFQSGDTTVRLHHVEKAAPRSTDSTAAKDELTAYKDLNDHPFSLARLPKAKAPPEEASAPEEDSPDEKSDESSPKPNKPGAKTTKPKGRGSKKERGKKPPPFERKESRDSCPGAKEAA
jgi:hypothetical protein